MKYLWFSKRVLLITLAVTLSSLIIYFVYFLYSFSFAPRTTTGVVTSKMSGCGTVETLQEDDSIDRKVTGICDMGDSISVGDMLIHTSAGATQWKSRQSNIASITPGDKVEVRYITENDTKSTNCESCYVKLVQKRQDSTFPEQ